MVKKRNSHVRKSHGGRKTRCVAKQRRSTKQRRTSSNKKAHFKCILLKLRKLKSPQRLQALRLANSSFIREFCSHVKKLRYAKLSPGITKKLKRHNRILRKLIHKKSSVSVKRKILSQRGGGFFLPLLAAIIPSIAGSIAGKIFGK
ncbi:MAG: hypothetical protein AAGK05_00125 [Pseudomonadota bacterium]